jgi:hypothetical protein
MLAAANAYRPFLLKSCHCKIIRHYQLIR